MTTIWQDLLQQQSSLTAISNVKLSHYFAPLPQLGILQVAGKDAGSFLQNLLTNDVAALALEQAQLNGLCNAKGRLLAIFLLIRQEEGFQIIAPKSMCELIQQRLTMYVLRSQVTISNENDTLFCIAWHTNQQSLLNTIQKIVHPNDDNSFLSIFNLTNTEKIISEFQQHDLALAPQNIWEQGDIEVGQAMIWPESTEKFTPQQVNLDLIGGVSFSKGCYPGQEIVARMHYLGKASRRLFIAEAHTTQIPTVATEVTTEQGSIVGHIVSAQRTAQSVKLLLSLKLTASNATLVLANKTPVIILKSL